MIKLIESKENDIFVGYYNGKKFFEGELDSDLTRAVDKIIKADKKAFKSVVDYCNSFGDDILTGDEDSFETAATFAEVVYADSSDGENYTQFGDFEIFSKDDSVKESKTRKSKKRIKEAKIAVNGKVSRLDPQFDTRKSFYDKAHTVDDASGAKILYSYNTPVCKINKSGDVELLPLWDSSQTTLRHVKEFLLQNGFEAGSKQAIAKRYGKISERFSRTKRNKRPVKESKILKEGAGAGYTIETFGINKVNINSIKYLKDDDGDSIFSITGSATIDGIQADSYMYGTGKIDKEIPVSLSYVWISKYYLDDVDFSDESALIDIAEEVIYEEPNTKFTFGGGWTHSTYDGQVGEVDRGYDSYWQGFIEDESIIHFIDEAVQGENTYVYYRIILDDFDVYDAYDTEDEAIRIATDLGESGEYENVEVEKVEEYIDYNGEISDVVDPYIEKVWEFV